MKGILNHKFITLLLVVTYCGLFIISCRKSQKSEFDYKSPQDIINALPTITPRQITKFSKVDTLFLQFLGIKTLDVGKGNFLLVDWKGRFVVEIDSAANLIKKITKNGRGPGEVEDVSGGLTRRPGGGVLVYDQRSRKTLIYNANFKYQNEFKVKSYKAGTILNIFSLSTDHKYIILLDSNRWMRENSAPRKIIVISYNSKTKSYSRPHYFLNRPYARLLIAGQAAGGAAVPFSANQVIRYVPQKQHFWMLWTPSGKIVEVNTAFDTLRTVSVNLPSQTLNSAEIDSLKEQYQKQQWKTLRKKLPDQKVPIQDMRVDQRGRFWLKLGYRSSYDLWLITNSNGKPMKIVQLPAGCYLTHISKYSLGVRLNNNTFALYSPVK